MIIELPSNQAIESNCIRVVRIGNARAADPKTQNEELLPRIMIEYAIEGCANVLILECLDNGFRDLAAADIIRQWKASQ